MHLRKLPFHCCRFSLQPAIDPVCTPDGMIFDITNIVPYVQQHKCNPVTGEPLKLKDLHKIKFHLNNEQQFHCPVTRKIFTDYSHICAVKKTGNVYSFDAIEKVCIKGNLWKDLLTDEPIEKEDLITIQDPKNPFTKKVSDYYHAKHIMSEEERKKLETDPSYTIHANASTDRIFAKLKEREKLNVPSTIKPESMYKSEIKGPLTKSSSLTSTGVNIITKDSSVVIEKTAAELEHDRLVQLMHKQDSKAFVAMQTSMGDLNLELYCGKAPNTCQNFLTHCEQGYYRDTKFHRLIPKFMIQGGDPLGTGKGGESIWKKPFEDEIHPQLRHTEAGILSMANKGPNTNQSQFFITFGAASHLDKKHTVFGKVVGGMEVLKKMEQCRAINEKPVVPIVIQGTKCYSNPFTDENLKKKVREDMKKESMPDADKQVGSWFTKPNILPDLEKQRTGVGKYIVSPKLPAPTLDANKKRPLDEDQKTQQEPPAKKAKFDFSSW